MNPGLTSPNPPLPPLQGGASLSDWDFAPNLSCVLAQDYYISPPSSLRVVATTDGYYPILCRLPDTLHLAQGRLITWWQARDVRYGHRIFYFRHNSPLGGTEHNNTYFIDCEATYLYVRKRINNETTTLGQWGFSKNNYTWYRYRITWWLQDSLLYIRLDRWINEEWVQLGDDIIDYDPYIPPEGYYRCGIGYERITYSYYTWFDDTEIWAPA